MDGQDAASRKGRGGQLSEIVLRTLQAHRMVEDGDTLVVGVSGGVDSMCLLDVLRRLSEPLRLRLVAAHLDHGLRGTESEQDFSFVEEQARRRYRVPFEGRRIAADAYGGLANLQAKARTRRYAFYDEVAQKWGARRIATGHHWDDFVETLLLQILRGTGTASGILHVAAGRYIRPLLDVRREEILRYAEQRRLPYREDSSNAQTRYLRNRLRHTVIPLIKREVNPSFDAALCRLFSILKDEGETLETFARDLFERALLEVPPGLRELRFRRDLLAAAPLAVRRRVIRLAYRRLTGSTEGLKFAHVEKLCESLGAGQSPARRKGRANPELSFPGGLRVFLDHDLVVFSPFNPWACPAYRYLLVQGEDLEIPEAGVRMRAGAVSADELLAQKMYLKDRTFFEVPRGDLALVVRNFRPGDRFRPAGLCGEKKLQDFFVDSRIPKSLRCRLPLLEINGRIAWVIGLRLGEGFEIEEKERGYIWVEVTKVGSEKG